MFNKFNNILSYSQYLNLNNIIIKFKFKIQKIPNIHTLSTKDVHVSTLQYMKRKKKKNMDMNKSHISKHQ